MSFRSDLTLASPLPVTGEYQLAVAGGGDVTSGVTWAVTVVSGSFLGAAPTMFGTGSAQLRINSALASAEAQLRITATVAGKTYPPSIVVVRRDVAAPTNTPLNITIPTSGAFTQLHSQPIQVTLTSSATSVTLSAVADLEVSAGPPAGPTNVEGKWQREISAGTWADVGTVEQAIAPAVFETEFAPGEIIYVPETGSISCNRTATGLTSGSVQRFRFVARFTGGGIPRDVFVNGSGNATI